MLRCNKAKDDLACDPKAIVVFKKKGLQDPRDCELPETCQSTEMFLLLPNSTCRCACIPAGWAPCWAVETEFPEGERESPEVGRKFNILYLWRNHVPLNNSKLSTHLSIFILGTVHQDDCKIQRLGKVPLLPLCEWSNIPLWLLYVRTAGNLCVCLCIA